MAWFHQFLKSIYHGFIWPIRTNFRIRSEKKPHFFQVVAKKIRMRNSELVKPCREQLSYQGKKDHGPPKVCKLILIRLEHYYVFIYVLLSFLPPVFLQISFERRKLQSHDVWTPSTTWRFRPDGKSIQPLRRHTKTNQQHHNGAKCF